MGDNKIKTLDELQRITELLRSQGKKIVHCHGCFDIVHFGHIQHFLSAKKQGDILIVTLTPDKFIDKGPGRPFFNENIRVKHISNLECVDYVALNKWATAIETIKIIKPDFYCKGKEVLDNADVDKLSGGKSNLSAEEDAVKLVGGKLYLTDEITFSASKIINEITDSISDQTKEFLKEVKKIPGKIGDILNSLKDIKILVIGDAILDEYCFCGALGKSGKDPIIVHKFLKSETYLGGSFAIANHLAGFTKNVHLVTCIGDNSKLIQKGLNKKIDGKIFVKKNSETIRKRRYIDDYKRIKIFEICNTHDLKLSNEIERDVLKYLKNNLDKFDIVLISDFGHGMITNKIKEFLTNAHKFLVVNSQLNGENQGYNFITKYLRADFVSLNENELRHNFQDKEKDVRELIFELNRLLRVNNINITRGKYGSIYYKNGEFFQIPGFLTRPVDTVGAGDAVLAIESLLTYKNINPKIIGLIGNCVGALACNVMGNKKPIDPIKLKKFISYVLK